MVGLSATYTELEAAIELFRAVDKWVLGIGPRRQWRMGLSASVAIIVATVWGS